MHPSNPTKARIYSYNFRGTFGANKADSYLEDILSERKDPRLAQSVIRLQKTAHQKLKNLIPLLGHNGFENTVKVVLDHCIDQIKMRAKAHRIDQVIVDLVLNSTDTYSKQLIREHYHRRKDLPEHTQRKLRDSKYQDRLKIDCNVPVKNY